MFIGALITLFAMTFHPKVTILGFAIATILSTFAFLSLAFARLFLRRSIGRMRTAMSSIIDVRVFSFPIDQVVDGSY
jgi:hypothetical protein